MNDRREIFLVWKLTPVIGSKVIEENLLSADFCCPLHIQCQSNKDEDVYKNYLKSNSNYQLSILNNSEINENVCSCITNFLNDGYTRKMSIQMDILLFSLAMLEFKRSRTFRSNVLSNFHAYFLKRSKKVPWRITLCPLCQKFIWMVNLYVYLSPTEKEVVDYKWSKRLQILVNERCELENAMAWLSTLGGAFSALGDTFIECAEKAALISMKQFRLALRLGDPITICRCKIYLAMSLLQQGYYGKTKSMIRDLYEFSVGPEGSKDFRLRNMCIAVWNRLKYVLSENEKKRPNLSAKARLRLP